VTGMHLVKGLNDDLVSVREISGESRKKVEFLKQQILLKSAKAIVLKRQKLRMHQVREVMVSIVKKVADLEHEALDFAKNQEYKEAVFKAREVNRMVGTFMAEGYNFKALEVVQDRVNKKLLKRIE
jgi:sensor domain CHASE-containing protein